LWLFYSALNILLVSNQYTAVDRAMRCLAVYWHRGPYLGSNNHLLYPVSIWLWSWLAGEAGVSAHSAAAFLHLAQALNAICAGGSVAAVYVLVRRFTADWKSPLLAALVYALSWTLLVHATSASEPMLGLFASLIALLLTIAGLDGGRLAPLFASGISLAFGLANYESMFLIAPLAYFLCLGWPLRSHTSDREHWLFQRVLRLLANLLGTVVGIVVIYGVAYYSNGITTAPGMLVAFFSLGGQPEVYSGFGASKLANLPVGLAGNVVGILPRDYRGMRWLVRTHNIVSGAAAVGICSLIAGALIILVRSATGLWGSRRAILAAMVCGAGLLFSLFPLLYWDPMYSKLWLQPLALLAVSGGVLAGQVNRDAGRCCAGLAMLLIVLESAVNLPQVVSAHVRPTRCLDDASIANDLIRPSDKVVTDFDSVSSLWMGLYDRDPSRTLLFPAKPASVSLATLSRWTRQCERSGCRIVFVALLDQPPEVWEAFLGDRLKVHHDALRRYRDSSRNIHTLSCESGSLRVYEPAAIQITTH
jgi:hypothetical protein